MYGSFAGICGSFDGIYGYLAHGAHLIEYMVVWHMCRALLFIYRALLCIYRVRWHMRRAFWIWNKSLLREYRACLMKHSVWAAEHKKIVLLCILVLFFDVCVCDHSVFVCVYSVFVCLCIHVLSFFICVCVIIRCLCVCSRCWCMCIRCWCVCVFSVGVCVYSVLVCVCTQFFFCACVHSSVLIRCLYVSPSVFVCVYSLKRDVFAAEHQKPGLLCIQVAMCLENMCLFREYRALLMEYSVFLRNIRNLACFAF